MMRRTLMTSACALVLLGTAGCSGTDSWFGSGSANSAPPAGTSGSSDAAATATGQGAGSQADGSGTSMGPTTTGRPAARSRGSWGAGMADDSGERNRAFYPGTLRGEGMWNSDSDAPGAN